MMGRQPKPGRDRDVLHFDGQSLPTLLRQLPPSTRPVRGFVKVPASPPQETRPGRLAGLLGRWQVWLKAYMANGTGLAASPAGDRRFPAGLPAPAGRAPAVEAGRRSRLID